MSVLKENSMVTTLPEAAVAAETSTKTSTNSIQWAGASTAMAKAELELQFEAARARNWITTRMVEQYQKLWHCSREVALERLLTKGN